MRYCFKNSCNNRCSFNPHWHMRLGLYFQTTPRRDYSYYSFINEYSLLKRNKRKNQ